MPDYVAVTFVQSLLHGTILHIVLENITKLCNWWRKCSSLISKLQICANTHAFILLSKIQN